MSKAVQKLTMSLMRRSGTARTIPDVSDEEKRNLNDIAIRARVLLRPFALLNPGREIVWSTVYMMGCGAQEGCCVLIAAAHFDLKEPLGIDKNEMEDDKMKGNDANYSHTTLEAFRLIDNMMNFVSTALVVMSLTLTIAATLISTALSPFSENDTSLHGDSDGKEGIPLAVLWAKNSDLMFVLHIFEGIFVALTAVTSAVGIYWGFFVYGSLGIYLVSLESKLRFLMEYITIIAEIWMYTFFSVLFLAFSLPCIAARISPVICLCAWIVPIGFIRAFLKSMPYGEYLAMDQHRTARAIFGIGKDEVLEPDN